MTLADCLLPGSCLISLAIVILEVVVTVTFFGCSWGGHQRIAGILEWIVAFMGAFYIWAFVGLVRYVEPQMEHSLSSKASQRTLMLMRGVFAVYRPEMVEEIPRGSPCWNREQTN